MHKESLYLKRFEFNSIKPGSNVLIIGKKATGKTEAVKDYLRWKTNEGNQNVIVFDPTGGFVDNYSKFATTIHQEVTSELLAEILDNIRKIKVNINERAETILIFDQGTIHKFSNDPSFECFIINGRCMKVTVFITCQYSEQLASRIRCNLDYILVGKENMTTSKKKTLSTLLWNIADFLHV